MIGTPQAIKWSRSKSKSFLERPYNSAIALSSCEVRFGFSPLHSCIFFDKLIMFLISGFFIFPSVIAFGSGIRPTVQDICRKYLPRARSANEVMKLLKLKKEQILFVGDNYNDVSIGKKVGFVVSADKTRLKGDLYVSMHKRKFPAEQVMDIFLNEL